LRKFLALHPDGKGHMKRLIYFCALVWGCAAQAQGTFQAITTASTAGSATVSGTYGWAFQTTTNLQVNALGAFNAYLVNAQGPVSVGLWNSAGVLLASNLVTALDPLVGESRYVQVSPLTLAPGQEYHVGAFSSGTIPVNFFGTSETDTIEMSPLVQLVGGVGLDDVFGYPLYNPDWEGTAFLAPNFAFTVVPEPSTFALLGLGGLLLALRRKMA
jgi:hypothetical protein